MKLAVCTPWASPFMYTKYVDGMLGLKHPKQMRDHIGNFHPLETAFFRGIGWCPARRHLAMCQDAIEWGADLICIVGADQIHPPDMLQRLVDRWNEGYEVISALVPTRGYIEHQDMKPFQPMAWRIPPNEEGDFKIKKVTSTDDLVVPIDVNDGDMQIINFIGTGVLMFHRDHILALDQPWFYETVDVKTCSRLACMDTKFVWRLQMEAGATVWVDTTIKVKHIHDMEIDDTFQDRFMDWKENPGEPEICDTSESPVLVQQEIRPANGHA